MSACNRPSSFLIDVTNHRASRSSCLSGCIIGVYILLWLLFLVLVLNNGLLLDSSVQTLGCDDTFFPNESICGLLSQDCNGLFSNSTTTWQSFRCPSVCTDKPAAISGGFNGIFPAFSPVCTAAVWDGKISSSWGGCAQYRLTRAQWQFPVSQVSNSFSNKTNFSNESSTRHGIKSKPYNSWFPVGFELRDSSHASDDSSEEFLLDTNCFSLRWPILCVMVCSHVFFALTRMLIPIFYISLVFQGYWYVAMTASDDPKYSFDFACGYFPIVVMIAYFWYVLASRKGLKVLYFSAHLSRGGFTFDQIDSVTHAWHHWFEGFGLRDVAEETEESSTRKKSKNKSSYQPRAHQKKLVSSNSPKHVPHEHQKHLKPAAPHLDANISKISNESIASSQTFACEDEDNFCKPLMQPKNLPDDDVMSVRRPHVRGTHASSTSIDDCTTIASSSSRGPHTLQISRTSRTSRTSNVESAVSGWNGSTQGSRREPQESLRYATVVTSLNSRDVEFADEMENEESDVRCLRLKFLYARAEDWNVLVLFVFLGPFYFFLNWEFVVDHFGGISLSSGFFEHSLFLIVAVACLVLLLIVPIGCYLGRFVAKFLNRRFATSIMLSYAGLVLAWVLANIIINSNVGGKNGAFYSMHWHHLYFAFYLFPLLAVTLRYRENLFVVACQAAFLGLVLSEIGTYQWGLPFDVGYRQNVQKLSDPFVLNVTGLNEDLKAWDLYLNLTQSLDESNEIVNDPKKYVIGKIPLAWFNEKIRTDAGFEIYMNQVLIYKIADLKQVKKMKIENSNDVFDMADGRNRTMSVLWIHGLNLNLTYTFQVTQFTYYDNQVAWSDSVNLNIHEVNKHIIF